MNCLKIGQRFSMDNMDYMVNIDDWKIVNIDYPTVTFSNMIGMCVEIAGREYGGQSNVVGTVFRETDKVVIIALPHNFDNGSGIKAGLLIKGDRASYLESLDPIILSHP
jgi:hypothetical protein